MMNKQVIMSLGFFANHSSCSFHCDCLSQINHQNYSLLNLNICVSVLLDGTLLRVPYKRALLCLTQMQKGHFG